MNPDLLVALVAGAVALGGVVWTGRVQQRVNRLSVEASRELESTRHERTEQSDREDRQREAAAILDQYRRPLLGSAVELQRRIGNIRANSFLDYLHSDDHRAKVAIQSTLYRFAAFLGWRELLTRRLTYLPFEHADQTRSVVERLEDVTSQLASSKLDIQGDVSRLMLWKDEQRAIGGLMLGGSDALEVMGFEAFTAQYDGAFALWLRPFSDDLRLPGIEQSERLERVAEALGKLVDVLDAEQVFKGRV